MCERLINKLLRVKKISDARERFDNQFKNVHKTTRINTRDLDLSQDAWKSKFSTYNNIKLFYEIKI